MRGLTPQARALLADFRHAESMDPGARRRVALALEERLASGAAGLEVHAPPPELPLDAGAPSTLSAIAKLTGVALGIGLMSFALLRTTREPTVPPRPVAQQTEAHAVDARDEPALQHVVVAAPAVERIAPATRASAPASRRKVERAAERRPRDEASPPPAIEAKAAATDAVESAAPVPAAPVAPAPVRAHETDGELPPQATRDEAVMIDEEMALLRSAHASLRAADPKRALGYLAEHRWRFPHGKLADSREVARMLALCASGEAALARTEARRFLAAQPRSPFAQRVRGICAEPKR